MTLVWGGDQVARAINKRTRVTFDRLADDKGPIPPPLHMGTRLVDAPPDLHKRYIPLTGDLPTWKKRKLRRKVPTQRSR